MGRIARQPRKLEDWFVSPVRASRAGNSAAECCVHIAEVGGSNPLSPTIIYYGGLAQLGERLAGSQ